MNLTIENSWWFTGGLWQDSDLKRVKNSSLLYRPSPILPQECLPDSVFTLRGPRRAGKTVALKLLVAEMIEKEQFQPHQIVWLTFEGLRTLDQAEALLIEADQKHHPLVLLIDEVTSLVGWQKVIKKMKDLGFWQNTCLILTGSSAYDLKAGAERMAGRRGKSAHPDRVLLPMSYQQFLQQPLIQNAASPTHLYLQSGGFPFRVEGVVESLQKNIPYDSQDRFQIFDDVFFYEIHRRKLERGIAIEIVQRLSSIGVSAISFDAFSKQTSVTRETIRRYLSALGDSFLLATISSFDTSRNRVALKKDKKIIWVDPGISEFGYWLGLAPKPSDAQKAEWIVGAELLRRYEKRLWEGLSAPRNVYTWKSSSGKEVDFLVIDQSRSLKDPFEVKYQNQIQDSDFLVMEKAFRRGTLITAATEKKRTQSLALPLEQWLKGF